MILDMVDEGVLFACVICFTVVVFVIETYLDIRQHSMYSIDVVPKELVDHVNSEDLKKSNLYHRDKSLFGFVSGSFDFVLNLFLLTYGLRFLWEQVSEYTEGEYYTSIVFVVVYGLASSIIKQPFSLYSTFVLEERHGFNKQTLGLYVKDFVKSQILAVAFGIPIVTALIYIVRMGGENFWLYLWLFVVFLQLIIMVILFPVIAPLFYTLKEIPTDGTTELGAAIAKLANRIEFPLTKVFEIDGSTRSSHSNAFFYGFGRFKRIVIFDTLIEQCELKELEAVLAHELGHWKMGHTYKLMASQLAYLFVFFFAFGLTSNSRTLYSAFGFQGTPVIIGLILFGVLLEPLDTALSLAMNILTRKYEYEADAYAARDLRYGNLGLALCTLLKSNKAALHNDPWYSWRHHSHPTLVERLNAIEALRID